MNDFDSPVLFSTNTYMKYHIQRRYRDNVHYVWCSSVFDSRSLGKYHPGALIGKTSNPAEIYAQLQREVESGDPGEKIKSQKATLNALAVDWWVDGDLTEAEAEEIIALLEDAPFKYWAPLLYVIPCALVEDRAKLVPPHKRASLGREWIIEDLQSHEFSIVDL